MDVGGLEELANTCAKPKNCLIGEAASGCACTAALCGRLIGSNYVVTLVDLRAASTACDLKQ